MPPASTALEHTSVAPASRVASRPKAKPPIQKNGELQYSVSVRRQAADLVEVPLMSEQPAWVCRTPLGAAVDPEV